MKNLLAIADPTTTPLINLTSFPAARFANVSNLMSIATPLIMLAAALLFGGMLFWAAFQIITAGGEPEKMVEAKKTATWAIVGLIIISLAFFFVKLITTILNVQVGF